MLVFSSKNALITQNRWEENDDPAKEHVNHTKECGWALNKCINYHSRTDSSQIYEPQSAVMNKAREDTFSDWWPHEKKRGWVGKIKKMAAAGFYYTPTDESDDMVTCAYCGLGLDGWESKDNPLVEHEKRIPQCPFFVGFSSNNARSSIIPEITSAIVASPKNYADTVVSPKSTIEKVVSPKNTTRKRRTKSRQATPMENITSTRISSISNGSRKRKSTQVETFSSSDSPKISIPKLNTLMETQQEEHINEELQNSVNRIPLKLVSPNNIQPSEFELSKTRSTNLPAQSSNMQDIFMWSPIRIQQFKRNESKFLSEPSLISDRTLSKEELNMTVEKWLQSRAEIAVKELEDECENMVKTFELHAERARMAMASIPMTR